MIEWILKKLNLLITRQKLVGWTERESANLHFV